MKKALCLLIAAVLLAGTACVHCYAAPETDWIITDPYAGVDWDSWGNYKFQKLCES